MAREDAFNAVVGSFSMYGALLKDVAEDVGMDRALEFHAKQGDSFGAQLSGMLKARQGDSELSIQHLTEVFSEVVEGFGMTPDIEATPTDVEFIHHKCPIYDGLKMAGWTHDEIKAACEGMGGREIATLQEANPRLSGHLTFRPTAEEPCVEAWTLSD